MSTTAGTILVATGDGLGDLNNGDGRRYVARSDHPSRHLHHVTSGHSKEPVPLGR